MTMRQLMIWVAVPAMLAVSTVPALVQRGERDRDHRHFFNRDGGGIAQES